MSLGMITWILAVSKLCRASALCALGCRCPCRVSRAWRLSCRSGCGASSGQALCELGWDHSMTLAQGFLWDGQVSQAAACSTLLQSCRQSCPQSVWLRAAVGRRTQPELRSPQLSDLPCKPCPESSRLYPALAVPVAF